MSSSFKCSLKSILVNIIKERNLRCFFQYFESFHVCVTSLSKNCIDFSFANRSRSADAGPPPSLPIDSYERFGLPYLPSSCWRIVQHSSRLSVEYMWGRSGFDSRVNNLSNMNVLEHVGGRPSHTWEAITVTNMNPFFISQHFLHFLFLFLMNRLVNTIQQVKEKTDWSLFQLLFDQLFVITRWNYIFGSWSCYDHISRAFHVPERFLS